MPEKKTRISSNWNPICVLNYKNQKKYFKAFLKTMNLIGRSKTNSARLQRFTVLVGWNLMMISLVLLGFRNGWVKADCNGVLSGKDSTMYCDTVEIQGLSFCSMMNGKFTDKAFFIKHVQNSTTTYAEYMDNYLKSKYAFGLFSSSFIN